MVSDKHSLNSHVSKGVIGLFCFVLIFFAFLITSNMQHAEAANPVVITTPQQLDDIRHDVEGDYVLGGNINLDVAPYNTGGGWEAIDGFKGTFDGKGYDITGLMIDSNKNRAGLFGDVSGKASFSNVNLVNVNVNAGHNVGALLGHIGLGGLIENVTVSGKISGVDSVGGVAGYLSNAKIKNSHADVTVTSTSRAGGLISSGGGEGAVIENSTSKGSVSTTGRGIGGLAGEATNIINSSSSAKVTSTHNDTSSDVGGLAGRVTPFKGEVTDSYATGDVHASNGERVGGLIGSLSSSTVAPVTNSYATGTVTGKKYVGGLVGRNNGIAISNSHSTGEVYGINSVGGLIGYHFHNDGIVQKSYSTSPVIATGDNVGGLIGETKDASKIIDTYARGNVSGEVNVGGLVGFNPASTIERSYASGKVTGSNELGGLVGNDVFGKFSTNAPNFYDKETTTMLDSDGATGEATINLQKRSTFKNWNFTSTWKLSKNDYPVLRDTPFDSLTDVSSGYWGRDDVTEIVETGIMSGSPNANQPGTFTFRPADNITRAEFAVVIINALGENVGTESTGFKDDRSIPNWAKKEVAKAKSLGIIKGDAAGKFNPSQKISRAEIATMVARAYDLPMDGFGGPTLFEDQSSIPSWAEAEVSAVVAQQIMQGQDRNGKLYFAPTSQAQRIEAGLSALRAYQLD